MNPTTQTCISSTAVAAILHDISSTLLPHPGLNERYIHHAFSHRLQHQFACLDVATPHSALLLHPEWPTVKNATSIAYAKYRNTAFPDGRRYYMPVDLEGEGTAGFIDFAIGWYNAPEIGVEFSLKKSWCNEEIVYDFLKLIDPRNPFKVAFSHNLIVRDNRLSRGAGLQDLEEHINDALYHAIHRLDGVWCTEERDVRFVVSEIAGDGRRHWHYSPTNKQFLAGLGPS
jgi:hypothetical protein